MQKPLLCFFAGTCWSIPLVWPCHLSREWGREVESSDIKIKKSFAGSPVSLSLGVSLCRDSTWFHKLFYCTHLGRLLNTIDYLELLSRPAQVHLPQFVQQVLNQVPVQHATSSPSTRPRPSLGPNPQHLVVSLPAGFVVYLRLFDLRVRHTEGTHQLLHLLHWNQIQHRVDQLGDCTRGEKKKGEVCWGGDKS